MIDFVSELLQGAGGLLLERRLQPREIDFKTRHSDLVTDADRASEAHLLSAIHGAFPRDAVVSEESGFQAGTSDYTWIVDPLDGTANYASGLPDFGIILGRLHGAEPVFGAMYLPATERLYLAERGAGATCNGEPVHVTAETELAAVLIDHSFHYREDPERMGREMRAFRAVWPHVRGVRSAGCLLYLAQLAEGQLGGFVAHEVGLWDLAGSSLILSEAGARVTDLRGAPLDLSADAGSWRRSLQAIGAGPALHAALLDKLSSAQSSDP